MKFKVGDRVAVYNLYPENIGLAPHHCEVIRVDPGLPCGEWIFVRTPSGGDRRVHSKQCRRLKPSAKLREYYVNPYPKYHTRYSKAQEHDCFSSDTPIEGHAYIHVREVRKGRK